MDIYSWLLLGHIVGTILGVGGASFIEFNLNNALRDGKVTPEEKAILGTTYKVVRVGLILAIVTGFGFLLFYKINGYVFNSYGPVLWAKIFMILIIGLNTVLLQARKMSLYWGSALSFVSWWAAAVLGFFLSNSIQYSFWSIMVAYGVAIIAGAFLLHQVRERSKAKAL